MAKKVSKEMISTVESVVQFLLNDADSESESLQSEALRYAANQIQQELDIDDGDLAFLPKAT